MVVMKFGGTSVGSPENMKREDDLIGSGERKIVVLSALSGTTNTLEELPKHLYQAYHRIDALYANSGTDKYDVVGPICESSDIFGKEVELPKLKRGDLVAIRSAGAYGEVMASRYNLRPFAKAYLNHE